jgi:Fe-S-cluster containining protein
METPQQKMRKLPIRLDLPEVRIEGAIELPHGAMRLVDFTTSVLGLSSTVADSGARIAADLGQQVSCSKGCGACCRQLTPLSPPEAIILADLVEALPEDNRTRVRNHFNAAVKKLERTGLKEKLLRIQNPSSIDAKDMQEITKTYFMLQIPCPFLKNEYCSIYAFRPSRCREYLVSSSPQYCRNPYERLVDRLPISIRLSEALAQMWAEAMQTSLQLVPLPFALEWSAKHIAHKDIGADAQSMLNALLFHIVRIARENQRHAVSALKGNASSFQQAPLERKKG